MRALCALFAVLLVPALASAQEVDLTQQQVVKLREVNSAIVTIKTLADHQIIQPDRADLAYKHYLDEASKVVGKSVAMEDIPNLLKEKETLMQQIGGFFTFTNIVWVIAGIMLAIAAVWLAGIYMLALLIAIPGTVYEIACYAAIATALALGNIWWMFPAALLLVPCLYFTKILHFGGGGDTVRHGKLLGNFEHDEVNVGNFKFSFGNFVSLVCSIAWGATAIYWGSELIGFMTVCAFFSLLGFSVLLVPGCLCIGYSKDELIPRTALASFIFLALYVAYEIMASQMAAVPQEITRLYTVFGSGIIVIGTFVYFISLLIISSRYYKGWEDFRYWSAQALTIASGLAALYIGSVYNISMLQKTGGSLFCLYVLEKYYEIPWGRVGYAWSLLGLAGGLYWLAGFAGAHPEYFVLSWK